VAKVKPLFLQNRFYADSGYDVQLREFCRHNKVHNQSFWTLTANPHVLHSQPMKALTQKYKLTAEQIFYSILMGEGIIPLIGTCSKEHMQEDLAVLTLKVEDEDRKTILGLLK
jgi:diketogulonate reductase-like aldo/keto reductase